MSGFLFPQKTLSLRKGKLFALTALVATVLGASAFAMPQTFELPQEKLRPTHPRLLFNEEQLPAIRARAEGDLKEHFAAMRAKVDEGPERKNVGGLSLNGWDLKASTNPEWDDWGTPAAMAALVYQVTGEKQYLEKAEDLLEKSVSFYEMRYKEGNPVAWTSFSRIDWLVALDMVWNDLDPENRRKLAERMLEHVKQIGPVGSKIRTETISRPIQGFYGPQSIYWFAGLLLHKEGIDDAEAEKLLKEGFKGYKEMLEHRGSIAGEDGGSGTGTLNYSLATYPLAEWNLFKSWEAAFGENLAEIWEYPALLSRFLYWNLLPGGSEFGYGDAPHTVNRIWGNWLYLHMRSIVHFYQDNNPEMAALAQQLADRVVEYNYTAAPRFANNFLIDDQPVLPYLLNPAQPEVAAAANLPLSSAVDGMLFRNMGQSFLRSGNSPEDTYLMISGGGVLGNAGHRHYDSGHFTLYNRGFQALDSGTRLGQGTHLQNYYGQSVAHNTLLIDMPGEEPAPYWNRKPEMMYGGQYRFTGSQVLDFYFHNNWAYAAYDLSPVYRKEKAEQVTRQFVFLSPDILVIFDRVTSTDKSYAKRWLLHTANEPRIEGKRFISEQGEGRLIATTLLPEDATLTAIGGEGKEFMVGDKNHSVPSKFLPHGKIPELMGRWRVEVMPGAERTEDVFLHVLEVGDQNRESVTELQVSEGEGYVELKLTDSLGSPVVIRFNTQGSVGGTISLRGQQPIALSMSDRLTAVPEPQEPEPMQRPYRLDELNEKGLPSVLAGVKTEEDWQKKRAEILQVWQAYTGERPQRPAPNVRILSEEDLGDHIRQRIEYDAAYGDTIPAWLLIPKGAEQAEKPLPAVLSLQHTNKHGAAPNATDQGGDNRKYAVDLVRRGYIVLAPDAMTSGDRIFQGRGAFNSIPFERQHPQWSTVGKNLSDHQQAVDVLSAHPLVDPERIGTIGLSFGGYNVFFLAAEEPRIKAVVSICGVFPFRGQTERNIDHWEYRQMPYTHIPRLSEDMAKGVVPFEFNEIMALAYPTPQLYYGGQNDRIFPNWEAVAEAFMDVYGLYRHFGKTEDFEGIMSTGIHDFPPIARTLSYDFLDKHLKP